MTVDDSASILAATNWPAGWYYAGHVRGLNTPRAVRLGDQSFVVFRGVSGQVSTLSGRCVHLGADLSRGCVAGDHLRCPFHEWEFAADGRCVRIPAAHTIPGFARQLAYPTVVRGGHVFFCNRALPPFAAPFFADTDPDDLHPARPFVLDVGLPWYMVGANGFDLQHFRAAHDRTLEGEPVIEQTSPHARTIRAAFGVTGNGVRDRLTRRFSGPRVTMDVTSWCGTMILVRARFRRTTSFGMVCVTPTGAASSRLTTIVWVPRSLIPLARALFDPLDAFVRRSFIRAFVRSDQDRSEGCRYTPGTLIAADAALADYFDWLAGAIRGQATSPTGG